MNALLLSAGPGERLRPLTLKTPKCLLELTNDQPILKYWIDLLLRIGIETIFINTFHLKERIIQYIDSLEENIKSRIYIYEEKARLEPVGEVLSNLSYLLGSPFLIINSDTYIEEKEIENFVRMAKVRPDLPIVLGLSWQDDTRGKSLLNLNANGIISNFVEKSPDANPGYSFAGILLMDAKVISSYNWEELRNKELAKDILNEHHNKMLGLKIEKITDIGGSLDAYRTAYRRLGKNEAHKECIYIRPGDDWLGGVYGDHVARYLFAMGYAKNKDVLDLGCGSGYGVAMLSYTAKYIKGLDYNQDVLAHAKNYGFQCPIDLECADLNKCNLPPTFDLVTAFEFIEHVDNPQKLIANVKLILNTKGTFIFSIPNENKSSRISIYHNHIFNFIEIKTLVEKIFDDIEWFGQTQTRITGGLNQEQMDRENYFIGVARA